MKLTILEHTTSRLTAKFSLTIFQTKDKRTEWWWSWTSRVCFMASCHKSRKMLFGSHICESSVALSNSTFKSELLNTIKINFWSSNARQSSMLVNQLNYKKMIQTPNINTPMKTHLISKSVNLNKKWCDRSMNTQRQAWSNCVLSYIW